MKRRELTVRAVVTAMVVAALIAGSYPYVVLKIGYGPNISVVSAFFGFIALSVIGMFTKVRGTRWENNMVQTAGTAAGQAGFMCVVLAAIDMLNAKPELGFSLHSSPMIRLWLSFAGMIGVLLAWPCASTLDAEKLPFAAARAGDTLRCSIRPKEAGRASRHWLRNLRERFSLPSRRTLEAVPPDVAFGRTALAAQGSEISLRRRLRMLWACASRCRWAAACAGVVDRAAGAVGHGIVAEQTFALVRADHVAGHLPAVAGGLTALILTGTIAKTFQDLSTKDARTPTCRLSSWSRA